MRQNEKPLSSQMPCSTREKPAASFFVSGVISTLAFISILNGRFHLRLFITSRLPGRLSLRLFQLSCVARPPPASIWPSLRPPPAQWPSRPLVRQYTARDILLQWRCQRFDACNWATARSWSSPSPDGLEFRRPFLPAKGASAIFRLRCWEQSARPPESRLVEHQRDRILAI